MRFFRRRLAVAAVQRIGHHLPIAVDQAHVVFVRQPPRHRLAQQHGRCVAHHQVAGGLAEGVAQRRAEVRAEAGALGDAHAVGHDHAQARVDVDPADALPQPREPVHHRLLARERLGRLRDVEAARQLVELHLLLADAIGDLALERQRVGDQLALARFQVGAIGQLQPDRHRDREQHRQQQRHPPPRAAPRERARPGPAHRNGGGEAGRRWQCVGHWRQSMFDHGCVPVRTHVGVHNFQRRHALPTIAGLEPAREPPPRACWLAAG